MSEYHERLLVAYTKIIGDLSEGEASVDIDDEEQEAIAELFIHAALQVQLSMKREEETTFAEKFAKLREGKPERFFHPRLYDDRQ